MARSRLLSRMFLLSLLASFALYTFKRPSVNSPTFFVAGRDADAGVLDWLHYNVIIASRKSYPLALMVGFCCFGNVLLRRECGNQRYANWLFGFPVGFICYTYPGAVFSDIMFVDNAPLRAMSNNSVLYVFTFWFLVIQYCDPVYRLLQRKHVFIMLTTWWLADATRASLCFLERAVTCQPVFSRGIWQCFIWCAAGPLARVAESSCIRGKGPAKLDGVVPNTLNAFKYPLISMFFIMFAYLVYMAYFTDCNIFAKDGSAITMIQCGDKHEALYAALTYLACGLHLARSYGPGISSMLVDMFGDRLCFTTCVKDEKH